MKKEKVDFLIRYEHKVRELESIMLIRMELERRGYSVAFICNYEYENRKKYSPKVLVSPAIYNNSNLLGDYAEFGPTKKVANLLWEQLIGIEDEENPKCTHNVSGIGTKAVTFCWGQQTKKRIVKGGASSQSSFVVGQLNLDLLKPAFRSTLVSKNELAEKFHLDEKKRWLLFISSFAYSELDEIQKELFIREMGQDVVDYYVTLSNESRSEILDWFEKALVQYPNDIIIYRPHPDEARKSVRLKMMEEKYPNFKVISELALKHWINASEKIYNWYSTGLVDATVLGKPFRLLRPVRIKREIDYRIYIDAKKITNEKEFLEDYECVERIDILNQKVFDSYYYIPQDYTYLKVCDILEELYRTNKYNIQFSFSEKLLISKILFKQKVLHALKPLLPLLLRMPMLGRIVTKHEDKKKRYVDVLKQGFEKNYATKEDIEQVAERIKPIIYGRQI